jgi:hypothetical protein
MSGQLYPGYLHNFNLKASPLNGKASKHILLQINFESTAFQSNRVWL